MKKGIIFIILGVVVIAVGVGFYFTKYRGDGGSSAMDWENPDKIFNVETPASFNDYQKERLAGKIAEAKTLYETKRGDTWTWIVIANMYKFVEDYSRAIGAYEQVLAIQPVEVISLGNLAHIYEKYQPNYEKAEYYYQRLLAASPSVPSYNIDFAKFYDNRLNNQEKAEAAYLNGLRNTGNNPDMLVAVIRFYQGKDNAEKVAEYAKLLLELNPDNELHKNEFSDLIENN